MKVLAVLFAVFAISFAQTVTPLVGTVTGSFAATDNAYAVNVYTLWLNENVSTATVQIADTTTTGCYYYIYASGREVPCGSEFDIASEDLYPCRGSSYNYDYVTSTEDFDIYPTSYSEYMYVTLGSYVYISVTRTSFSDADACTYTLTPTVTECPEGQLAVFQTGTPECFPVTHLDMGPTSTNTTYHPAPVLADGNDWVFFRIWVPVGTASLHLTGNVTTTGFSPYIYLQNRYAPGSSYYVDYFYGSSVDTDTYAYDDYIYNPQWGYFYFGFTDYPISASALTVELKVCGAGMGGWNCTYTVNSVDTVTPVATSVTLTNPSTSHSPYSLDTQYFILSTTTPMVTTYVNYTFTLTSGDVYVYYRKDGFVDDDSDQYVVSNNYDYISTAGDFVNIALTPADLALPGNFVIAVQNDGTYPSTAVVAVASAATSSSSTTGDATGNASTDSTTTGSASSVAYCFALIALCVAALF
jgi:hypothetical protein